MKIYAVCEGCRHKKFFIRKRVYKAKSIGRVVSKSELCGHCYRMIRKMVEK